MCAGVAGQRSRRVLLLEHNAQPGRKILISGGGRCNFTNIHCTPANFISENPHFAKSALALYQPRHFLELVERYGIKWHEKTLGQLFCDHSARQIVDLLLAECERGRVEICLMRAMWPLSRLAANFACVFCRRVCGRRAGGCYRRIVDSEDGRDRAGVRAGAAVRIEVDANPACAGAPAARRIGKRLDGAGGGFRRCDRFRRIAGRSFARSC